MKNNRPRLLFFLLYPHIFHFLRKNAAFSKLIYSLSALFCPKTLTNRLIYGISILNILIFSAKNR